MVDVHGATKVVMKTISQSNIQSCISINAYTFDKFIEPRDTISPHTTLQENAIHLDRSSLSIDSSGGWYKTTSGIQCIIKSNV